MMGQPNGCSTPAPKSSAAKQWKKGEFTQKKDSKRIEVSSIKELLQESTYKELPSKKCWGYLVSHMEISGLFLDTQII